MIPAFPYPVLSSVLQRRGQRIQMCIRDRDGDVLHLIHIRTAAVVALAGQALGVLVGEDAAHGGHDGGRDDVLAGDELDIFPLAGQLTVCLLYTSRCV